MGSIAGIVSKAGKDVSKEIAEMLIAMKHRGPDYAGVLINDEIRVSKEVEDLDLSGLEGPIALGHNHLSIIAERGYQPILGCEDIALVHDGTIYNYEKLKDRLTRHNFSTGLDSEAIVHLVEDFYARGLTRAVKDSLAYLDGPYAFAVKKGDDVVIARDPIGIKPLYLGESDDFIAFTSERKALWRIGIEDTKALLPGHIALLTRKSISMFASLRLKRPRIRKVSPDAAEEMTRNALYNSVEKCMRGIEKAGIAFSGGVDSCIIAKAVFDVGKSTILYTVGLEGSTDVTAAEETCSELGYELRIRILTIDEVRKYIPKVVWAIEEADVMKVSIGLPLYVAAEFARSDGLRSMISGQGSDEIFGGYAKYLKVLEHGGYDMLHQELWRDVVNTHEVNLQRDDAVSMANSVDLRYPYLDPNVIKTAMSIPPWMKIESPDDRLRKRILRDVARSMEISSRTANRLKKAIQYGSGVDKAMRRLSKELGFKSSKDYIATVFSEIYRKD